MVKSCLTALLLLTSLLSYSQDNYWSDEYNAGGFLSPGAVIAFNRDSGVFFYNPALLALTRKSSASISANIYRYESIRIKDGAGIGKNLNSTSTGIVPQMISGVIALPGKKPFSLGYALIRSAGFNYQVSQRQDKKMNVLDDSYSPGDEYFIGQYSNQNIVSNTQLSLSAGFTLSPKFTAGISIEPQFRKQNYFENTDNKTLLNVNNDSIFPPLVSFGSYYSVNYTHVGIRFKAGFSYNENNHHLGLLITSPLLRLWSNATLLSDITINNIKFIPDAPALSLLANSRQENLKVAWKTPVSIALGYTYDYGKGQIYVATEYFSKISQYNAIYPRDGAFLRPDTGNNNNTTQSTLRLKDAHKQVINFALGVSFPVKENVYGYCSARTDFTYADNSLFSDDQGATSYTSYWNNYHMQVGANFKKRKFNLRTGLLFTYGHTNSYEQPIDFTNPKDTNLLLGTPGLTKATHFAVGFMMAYVHNL